MPSDLGKRLARAVADVLCERGGAGARALEDALADPGLLDLQRTLSESFDQVLTDAMGLVPMEPVAPAKRWRGDKCAGMAGRCATHQRPLGADLQCDVGRGGPLVLPKPTAQKRRTAKRAAAKKLRPRAGGRR
jgi:hypothetical protein